MLRRPAARGGAAPKAAAAKAAAAKAKAAAAKVAPRRGGAVRRRPAARVRAAKGPEDHQKDYEAGRSVEGHLVPPGCFESGDWIVSEDAQYYQVEAPISARVVKEEIENKEREVLAELVGTKNEELLKHATNQKPCYIRLHLCPPSCTGLRHNPNLVHMGRLKKVPEEKVEAWGKCLIEEGETDLLRADAAKWEAEKKKKEEEDKEDSSSTSGKKKSKKKKKKKEKKRKKEEEAKRKREGEEGSPEKKKLKLGGRTSAQKTKKALFEATGMDPSPKRRRKLAKKVSKLLKKVKESNSSSGTEVGSDSSDSQEDPEGLLSDQNKIRRISQLAPGLLSSRTLEELRPHVMQYGVEDDGDRARRLDPIVTMYHRQSSTTDEWRNGSRGSNALVGLRPTYRSSSGGLLGHAIAKIEKPGDGEPGCELGSSSEAGTDSRNRTKPWHQSRVPGGKKRSEGRPCSQRRNRKRKQRKRKRKGQRERQRQERKAEGWGRLKEAMSEEKERQQDEEERRDEGITLPRLGGRKEDELEEAIPRREEKKSRKEVKAAEGQTTEEESKKGWRDRFGRFLTLFRLKRKERLTEDRKTKGEDPKAHAGRKGLPKKFVGGVAATTNPFLHFTSGPTGSEEAIDTSSGLGRAESKQKECADCESDSSSLGFVINWLNRVVDVFKDRLCKTSPSGRLFPLPSSPELYSRLFPHSRKMVRGFLRALLVWSLNSLNGEGETNSQEVSDYQRSVLEGLLLDCERVSEWICEALPLDWDSFFRVKGVDYKGDEVQVAQSMSWENVSPALPREVGGVNLEDVVELGSKHYVLNFEDYLLDERDQRRCKAPRVMVPPDNWSVFCIELLKLGIFDKVHENDVYRVEGEPLLNGLFGVSKNEYAGSVEIMRIIMNLIPLNGVCRDFAGDVGTLPSWAGMTPLQLQPDENLVVSSEDVRCFFYIFRVPKSWHRFLAFNRLLPKELAGDEPGVWYPCSSVLPMGFKNSVSLAQHVHRFIVKNSLTRVPSVGGESELRKDRSFPDTSSMYRIYLDNFDLLEKTSSPLAQVSKGLFHL